MVKYVWFYVDNTELQVSPMCRLQRIHKATFVLRTWGTGACGSAVAQLHDKVSRTESSLPERDREVGQDFEAISRLRMFRVTSCATTR